MFESGSSKKLPVDHPVFDKLRDMIHYETPLNEWYQSTPIMNLLAYTGTRFGLAEQAINAIYILASQPDILCGDIVKQKTRSVFIKGDHIPSTPKSVDATEVENTSTTLGRLSSVRSLSQLLFIVGHIASRPISENN